MKALFLPLNSKSSGDIIPGYVLYKKRVATERHNGYEQVIDKLALLAKKSVLKNLDLHSLSGIGLASLVLSILRQRL